MPDSHATKKHDPEFLTVPELAALLRLSKVSVYRLIERREIAFHRLPRGLRFAKEDVEAFLKGRRIEPIVK